MPDSIPNSSYAQKVRGIRDPVYIHRTHPVCDGCGKTFAGKRNHGFPSRDGRVKYCGHCSRAVGLIR